MAQVFRTLLMGLALSWGGPAASESPPPFPDFHAKRVRAPKPGSKPKIDVQIGPVAQPQAGQDAGRLVKAAVPPAATARYGWFWDDISPALSATGPGRLEPALQRLAKPPAGQTVAAPRLGQLLQIAKTYGPDILMASVGTEVSPALILAVIAIESGGDGTAESGAGAQGLMQLMPATSERFGVAEPLDARQNIKGGVAFLDMLMRAFKRDPILVLAGYNAGEAAVRRAQGVPDFAETRDYVPKVLAAYAVARGMCATPPQLISDGCVFVTR